MCQCTCPNDRPALKALLLAYLTLYYNLPEKLMTTYYEAINWNEIEDVIDKSTWEKLTEQFWLDTRIPLSNDLDDWRRLSAVEKDFSR